jgi:hypothetical protein
MNRYSEAVKADVRRRMGPPHRQSVAEIFQQLGIHVITLYKSRKAWRLQGEVVPASQKDPEGWGPADKFTVVPETAGLNATELSAPCSSAYRTAPAAGISRPGEHHHHPRRCPHRFAGGGAAGPGPSCWPPPTALETWSSCSN